MFYTIYKITNQINGKFYIGKHVTSNLDDDYMGFGKLIRSAIKKYGIESFTKEYLEVLNTEQKMNLAEKIYVINDLEVSYNLCPGGQGGFGYINENGLNNSNHDYKHLSLSQLEKWKTIEYRNFHSNRLKTLHKEGKMKKSYFGERGELDQLIVKKAHSDEANKKRKETYKKHNHQQGINNSSFGKPRSEETKQKIREGLARNRALKNS